MINALLNGILGVIVKLLDIFLTPVNLLFSNIFPDMTYQISVFEHFLLHYVGRPLAYFFRILPVRFLGILKLWFTFLVAYYSIYYTYLGIIKIWKIIQKIKFW